MAKGDKQAVKYIHTPDSIVVKRNAKGDCAWDVKIYYDSEQGTNKAHDKVITKIAEINNALAKKFG